MSGRRGLIVTISALPLGVVGCVETTVTGESPMLGGLPGVVTGMESSGPKGAELPESVAAVDRVRIESEDPDEPPTLLSKSVMDLLRHIAITMDNGERDLFTDQVLSEMTKQEYYERGLDPREAFDTLKGRERSLRILFSRMPQGEFTPGLFMRPMGGGVYRLQVRPERGMYYRGIDVVFEKRNWRLRWFVR